MAPAEVVPLQCDAKGCDFQTAEGMTMTEAVQHLGHHVIGKHPTEAGGGGLPRGAAKVEAWKWLKVTLDTSEGDLHYFQS